MCSFPQKRNELILLMNLYRQTITCVVTYGWLIADTHTRESIMILLNDGYNLGRQNSVCRIKYMMTNVILIKLLILLKKYISILRI